MPIFKSKLTSKGQITIPLEVRRRLGIKQGDEVEFETGGAETFIRPVRKNLDSFSKWRGVAKGTLTPGSARYAATGARIDISGRYECDLGDMDRSAGNRTG
jgi:AbrB family looped-hinge helix DNA binding protein